MNNSVNIEDLKQAGEIHTSVKKYIYPLLYSGMKIIDICKLIETKIAEEVNKISSHQLNNGIAFPTGISINNVAAHYTPAFNDDTTIKNNDVIKIDYGVHINGNIIDSAFTINFSNEYSQLLDASHEAVKGIIKNIGVDSRFGELSKISQEIVESYEYNDTPLKVIDNLAGHNIKPWTIHAGKLLYGKLTNNPEYDDLKIDDGEVMAIEVFVSNGNGTTILDMNPVNHSHYMLKNGNENIPLFQNKKTNQLINDIKTNFNTLPFCPRFIDNINGTHRNYTHNLHDLFNSGYINSYPPLLETNLKSKVAQFEHTIYVSETKKINFTE
jgi:methionyl aminopeptidase